MAKGIRYTRLQKQHNLQAHGLMLRNREAVMLGRRVLTPGERCPIGPISAWDAYGWYLGGGLVVSVGSFYILTAFARWIGL
jgi:hypothetical protein